MILVIFYSLAVSCFMVSFVVTHIVKTAKEIMAMSHEAITVISSKQLSDLEKEKAIQKSAINMSKNFCIILFKFIIIGLTSMTPVTIGELLAFYSYEEFTSFTLRWDVLIITTLAAIAAVYLLQLTRKQN